MREYFREIWKREFGKESMSLRARRRANMYEIKYLLDYWSDYGNPDYAEKAIALIKENM